MKKQKFYPQNPYIINRKRPKYFLKIIIVCFVVKNIALKIIAKIK